MAATQITVTHTFLNPDGSAASGVIAFKLSARITNASASYAPQVPVHSTLNSMGQLSQVLPANNDPATTPANSFYTVTFFLNSAELSGGVVDLGSLLPQQQGA
jgi:hypothetical protein